MLYSFPPLMEAFRLPGGGGRYGLAFFSVRPNLPYPVPLLRGVLAFPFGTPVHLHQGPFCLLVPYDDIISLFTSIYNIHIAHIYTNIFVYFDYLHQ